MYKDKWIAMIQFNLPENWKSMFGTEYGPRDFMKASLEWPSYLCRHVTFLFLYVLLNERDIDPVDEFFMAASRHTTRARMFVVVFSCALLRLDNAIDVHIILAMCNAKLVPIGTSDMDQTAFLHCCNKQWLNLL